MRTETNSSLSFSHYSGGDSFLYFGKIFHKSKRLGNGAYGEVFLFESEDHTKISIKSELPYKEKYFFANGFKAEANWYKEIYGTGEFSGDPKNTQKPHYILMPFFEGKTIFEINYLSPYLLFQHWIKTANALNGLHKKNKAVHCDLKIDNVIIGIRSDQTSSSQHEQAFIIDFGAMLKAGQKRNYFNALKWDSATYWQHPPEVFTLRGKKIAADFTQDIYSLGMLLRDIYHRLITENPEITDISETVNDVKKNLTHPNPNQRWSITKAVYLLTVAFFSKVSRDIWIQQYDESDCVETPWGISTELPSIVVYAKNSSSGFSLIH